ncbi:hypothetical protein E6C67_34340 [Azospirillum sp. TSA2s]|nr:hypothetical protein E6C67_34340 [Azospirillum sp. TSA2s]
MCRPGKVGVPHWREDPRSWLRSPLPPAAPFPNRKTPMPPSCLRSGYARPPTRRRHSILILIVAILTVIVGPYPGKPAALQRDEARSRPACPGPSYGFRGRPPPRHDHGGLTRRHAHATRKTPRGDTPPRPLSFGTLAGFSSEQWPLSNRNTRPASSESAYLIKDTLDQHDVRYEFRPPKTPHYGGHIERLAGTLGKKIHALPGATFSNPKQRGEYKSEAKAKMTLEELRVWLLNHIVGIYHNKVHDGTGFPPLARWSEGIIGSDRMRGRGLPEPIQDPRRLRLDFLPFIERTVQPEGIVWDKIWYRDPLLSQWVRADEGRRRRKFRVRRDPTDISKLYFLDPSLGDYVEIPYRDYGRPSISLWDYRAAEAYLRRQGKAAENEAAIFEAYEEMHRITVEAAKETKRVRRERAKLQEQRKHRAALTLDPPQSEGTPAAREQSKPDKGSRRDGHLALVVDNAHSAPIKPSLSAGDFDFDDSEIKTGVEEW